MTSEMVYQRDASWWNKPDVRSLKKYHFDNGIGPACGINAVLTDFTGRYADTVPERLRCRKSGCKQRWPVNGEQP